MIRCPLCGSWYNIDPKLGTSWVIGEVCGNQAMTGPNPELCCPEHPCEGLLIQDNEELQKKFTKENIAKWRKRNREYGAEHARRMWENDKRRTAKENEE